MTDFAVVIDDLPASKDYVNFESLRCLLTEYIDRLVSKTEQQHESLAGSKVNPSETMTIYFGNKDLSDVEQLHTIKNLMVKGQYLRRTLKYAVMSGRLEFVKRRLHRAIESIKVDILRMAQEYRESKVTEKAVKAFVIFRSMEGLERFMAS